MGFKFDTFTISGQPASSGWATQQDQFFYSDLSGIEFSDMLSSRL